MGTQIIRGTLTPAYGRDYNSQKQVLEDLMAGKDFLLDSPWGETYVNLQDLQESNTPTIQVRYRKQRQTFVFEVPRDPHRN